MGLDLLSLRSGSILAASCACDRKTLLDEFDLTSLKACLINVLALS